MYVNFVNLCIQCNLNNFVKNLSINSYLAIVKTKNTVNKAGEGREMKKPTAHDAC